MSRGMVSISRRVGNVMERYTDMSITVLQPCAVASSAKKDVNAALTAVSCDSLNSDRTLSDLDPQVNAPRCAVKE